jgi:hypothetical protein
MKVKVEIAGMVHELDLSPVKYLSELHTGDVQRYGPGHSESSLEYWKDQAPGDCLQNQ